MGLPMAVRPLSALLVIGASLIFSSRVAAQAPTTPDPAPPQAPVQTVELDQNVVNVPTTMPLKRHQSYFKITHRFARDLRRGSLGQLAEDAFSLDNGAIIGLEYRFALTSTLQAGIHRSILGKTIETFAKWDVRRQTDGLPVGLSVAASIEGQNNLHLDPQPGFSAVISRTQGSWLALYVAPTYVHNAHTETLRASHGDHDHVAGEEAAEGEEIPGEDSRDTTFIGLGLRARVRETVSIVAEVSPRLAGYRPDRAAWNIGVEKLTRGHVLQLNFGNNFDSTPGMVARGGSKHDIYMGFNMSRKF
jgi:uncharacterized beta barrel domain-containing protein DUF5777